VASGESFLASRTSFGMAGSCFDWRRVGRGMADLKFGQYMEPKMPA
jgi:hypothetical protein